MNKKSRWKKADIIEQKVDITQVTDFRWLNLETLKCAVE